MNLLDRAIAWTLPIVPKPLVRHFARPYVAGTTTDDAIATVRRLREEERARSTLDILGEFIATEAEARRNADAYVALATRIRDERLDQAHVSIKLTALGLLLDRELCLENMVRVMEAISASGNFLRIDMEDSGCTGATIDIYENLRERFGAHVGIVLQARLRRTRDDVLRITERPANVRLCKGIYLEPRRIAYTDRVLIQRNFTALLELLFDRGAYVGIATHDELLAWEALEIVARRGLGRDDYEFQMLLGVDPTLRRVLLDAGHPLRVYVPFGENWYAYSVRRLRENPQVAGHAFRALFRRDA